MRDRRTFLRDIGSACLFALPLYAARELDCDVAVIGGGTGGCAAAVAALRNGMRVILTEETDWIGGQLTSQAVPPDEHPWIESFGCTRLYREYRQAVREYYRRNYPLTEEARARWNLVPGNYMSSGVGLSHEPRVSLAVLGDLLAPFVSTGQLTVFLRHKPVAADVSGDHVRSVTIKDIERGRDRTVHAKYFLDATEMGELLPLTRTEYVTGFESGSKTGEPHAPERTQPENIQAFTWCLAVDYIPGEDHTIDKPEEYGFWRDFTPALNPPYSGKLLDLTYTDPQTLKPRFIPLDPDAEYQRGERGGWWGYRRLADKRNFKAGAYRSSITMLNWPQNDFYLGNIFDAPAEDVARNLKRAKQLSLSLLYWIQTEAPRPDGGRGWPGVRLRPDVVGTDDGFAKYPYVREGRRIEAEFTVTELHVGAEARAKITGKKGDELTAEYFPDSVGVGCFRIDLHPSSGGDNYIDFSSLPFQIPLGALIPKRMENLLPACKNLGVTHLTNGCYRLHPVEWNIGESAGLAAAHAVQTKTPPRRIRNNKKLLKDFQSKIVDQGVMIAWPKVLPT
jgi:hypothetical protein